MEYPERRDCQVEVKIHDMESSWRPALFYWNGGVPTFAQYGSDITIKVVAWRYPEKNELVGKTLRSKINGNLFYVAELFSEEDPHGRVHKYYKICELGTDKYTAIGKEWFERGYMQNLEICECL